MTRQANMFQYKQHIDMISLAAFHAQSNAVAKRNERERNRVKHINGTFNSLKQHLPCAQKNKKMSKVETLRTAIR